jgi:hypothetical protein
MNARTVSEVGTNRTIQAVSDEEEDLRHTLVARGGQNEFPYHFPIVFPKKYDYRDVEEI